MQLAPRIQATVLLAGLLISGPAQADTGCDPELSTSTQCWHDCNTEDEITICEITWCMEGIGCPGIDWDDEAGHHTLTIPTPDTRGPRVGDVLTTYVDGRRVRGEVTTRIYQSIAVDSSSDSELVIVVTPYLTAPTKRE